MLRLAMPALAEEFLVLAVMWTDWWLTGHFFQQDGDATKTAMSMMGYLLWLIPSLFAAVAIGATALVARNVGSNQSEQALKTTNQAFVTGAVLALCMLALAFCFGTQFIGWMQLTGSAAMYAVDYMYIVIWSIPLIMFSIVGSSCLRGAGDMVTGFVTKSIVVLANIVISFSLVVGWGPFPQVGWLGLAIGTAIGHALGGLIILSVLIHGRVGLQLRLRWMIPDLVIIRKILRVGLPGGFDVAVLLFSQLVFLAMINALGVAAAAAHGLAVQIEAVCFLPGAAFQAAAATMAGQFLGASARSGHAFRLVLPGRRRFGDEYHGHVAVLLRPPVHLVFYRNARRSHRVAIGGTAANHRGRDPVSGVGDDSDRFVAGSG